MTVNTKAYDAYFDMFASDGWKQYITLNGIILENLKNQLVSASDMRQVGIVQGDIRRVLTVLNFEQTIRDEYDDIASQ